MKWVIFEGLVSMYFVGDWNKIDDCVKGILLILLVIYIVVLMIWM